MGSINDESENGDPLRWWFWGCRGWVMRLGSLALVVTIAPVIVIGLGED